MDLHLIDDEGVWNAPLLKQANTQFLQSWEWGVFQQLLGRTVRRLQLVEGDTVVAAIQFVEHRLSLGRRYWYAPRGPVLFNGEVEMPASALRDISRAARELGRESGAVFLRLEPVLPTPYLNLLNTGISDEQSGEVGGKAVTAALRTLGCRPTMSVQPPDEFAMVVQADEEDLLAAMHDKARYNIRLAERHGVRARLIEQLDYARRVFPFFWNLIYETAQRQRIRTHPRAYYAQMIDYLIPRERLKLMVAEHDNHIVAGHLLTVFGDTVCYIHGGSSYAHRSLMAPYLLHWEGLRLAKRLGKTYYNLGGVAPAGASEHPWQNLTRFKEGFVTIGETGERFHYPGAFDLVTSPFWYRIYGVSRRLRRLGR